MVPERRDDVLLVAHGDAQRLSQAVQVALDVFQFLQGIADHIPVVHIPPVPVDAAHVLHVMVDGAGVVKGPGPRPGVLPCRRSSSAGNHPQSRRTMCITGRP